MAIMNRRDLLRSAISVSAIPAIGTVGAKRGYRDVGENTRQPWKYEFIDTIAKQPHAETPGEDDMCKAHIGSSVTYRGTLDSPNLDYVLHDMTMENIFSGFYYESSGRRYQEGIDYHDVGVKVVSNNTSEIHPNYFDKNSYVGATPNDGTGLNWVNEDLALASILAAAGLVSTRASIVISAYSIFSALSNDDASPPPIQKEIGYSWEYWNNKETPANRIHLLWSTPKWETSKIKFRGGCEATSYSIMGGHNLTVKHWGTGCAPSPTSSVTDGQAVSSNDEGYTPPPGGGGCTSTATAASESVEIAGVTVPSQAAVVDIIESDEVPKGSPMHGSPVVKYISPNLRIVGHNTIAEK